MKEFRIVWQSSCRDSYLNTNSLNVAIAVREVPSHCQMNLGKIGSEPHGLIYGRITQRASLQCVIDPSNVEKAVSIGHPAVR